MRLGVVLDQRLSDGGGFQQSINAVKQLQRIRPDWLRVIIFTTVPENATHPALAGVPVHVVKRGMIEKLRCAVLGQTLSPLLARFLYRSNVTTVLEREMRIHDVDLVYFLSPSDYALALQNLPYILTVWDLCHRDHPEFPEVSRAGEYLRRENYYRLAINRSYLTVTDSEELSRRVMRRYGTDSDRLLAMPYQPAGFVSEPGYRDVTEVAARLELPKDFLFYPAQLWPHKNHVRILQALAQLKCQGERRSAVFAGGDRNGKTYLQVAADELGVSAQIVILGFVDDADMAALYSLSHAVVCPTYFGPTNLPPLEAWAAGKPVIYSTALAVPLGDAALSADPDSAEELADVIHQVYADQSLVTRLVAQGILKLREIEQSREQAERLLLKSLHVFRNRRQCWHKDYR